MDLRRADLQLLYVEPQVVGAAKWGQGTWDRELGTGKWGAGNWGQQTGDRELGTGQQTGQGTVGLGQQLEGLHSWRIKSGSMK